MFVSAAIECWPGMELLEAIEILSDLGFTSVELAIHESGVVKPSELLADWIVRYSCFGTHIAWISRVTACNWNPPASSIMKTS